MDKNKVGVLQVEKAKSMILNNGENKTFKPSTEKEKICLKAFNGENPKI